jgi:SAM-dependent methyltransferase
MTCRICGEPGDHERYTAREMMFGSREPFEYFECRRCGCLQIAEIPADLGRFYGGGYYSYATPPEEPRLKRYMKRKRTEHALGSRSFLGSALLRVFGPPTFVSWVRNAGAGLDARVLDVGSGSGDLLRQMRTEGFMHLTGVDPYVEADLEIAEGVAVLRRSLSSLTGEFELIMLHHAFEHMPDPKQALCDARRLLRPTGTILIRIPVAGSYAWRSYGTDWVQLDAPRHLHLHTSESMRILADGAGLEIVRTEYDSTGFQFWGSEQYRRGISLTDPRSHAFGSEGSVFSRREMKDFERRAAELNRKGIGDSACFYLRKKPS